MRHHLARIREEKKKGAESQLMGGDHFIENIKGGCESWKEPFGKIGEGNSVAERIAWLRGARK